MKHYTCFWLVLVLLGMASCSQVEYDIFGTLTGTVVDEATGQPVEGASVLLTPGGANVMTDAHGAFTFAELDAKQYTLMVQKHGYVTNRKTVTALPGETSQVAITLRKAE